MVQEELGEMLWKNHPLGRPLIGPPRNILKISREDILTFKKSRYIPQNTVIAIAGNVDHDEAVRRLEKSVGQLARGRKPVCRPVTASTPQDRVVVRTRDIEQTHLAMGFRLFGRHDSRRYALRLLSVVLGENMSSRLFQVVREKNGLAYAIHSSVQLVKETGTLAITAGLERKRAGKALRLIIKELQKLKDQPVGKQLLRRAKDYAVGQMIIGLESTATQMSWMGERLLGHETFLQPEVYARQIEKVTAGDIQHLAGQILRARRASVAMITPENDTLNAETIEDILSVL